ncbi:tRNA uridine-5-carboxymethylaminomethyl(34) synthesis GTPase MnmE [Maribacter sp. ACAM166]|uniref:tRNA uridine-5-carboxymethylaminomethyl(34) synthesis GTPase MnmE n=1 Tax=Maribacter sp. ACAM166 TaxID=2508996 RepID=UPI0010FE10CE|nr:tRNA uridine-5-carboxymethylaminomethyl(34) synthesis GTPase MnmE [Maribacter sp. ACAM166]TLP77573.1 tRNA uridine-5-carboxymethylaminomethyl(34) synthesis GTPase MnmE [Maribacter sp. ACAM166]
MIHTDTIIALATPSGSGAIAIIRLSGVNAISIVSQHFESVSGKKLEKQKTHTLHLGFIKDGKNVLDQVLISIFKNPNSYTGEDVIEISCHGSLFIQQEIIQLFLRNGIRMATPGEFTMRSFLNGKMDLSQAEAVADLIASDNASNHQVAIQQMRGGFSNKIKELRQQLLNFASLIELELDFSEEDVEFANRDEFRKLLNELEEVLKKLIDSFALGNVIKTGVPVAIIGEPNVGKSTLLNVLLNEERALVSDIAGTTRDTIEDEIVIGGISFRFIDTAGIRETTDVIEGMGIQRTYEKTEKAQVILYLVSGDELFLNTNKVVEAKTALNKITERFKEKSVITVINKVDRITKEFTEELNSHFPNSIHLSAREKIGVDQLENKLLSFVETGKLRNNETIVTNSRHYDSLLNALTEIKKVQQGLDNELSGDLLSLDIKAALFYFGEITGEITNDELLGNIFANFCIGK